MRKAGTVQCGEEQAEGGEDRVYSIMQAVDRGSRELLFPPSQTLEPGALLH